MTEHDQELHSEQSWMDEAHRRADTSEDSAWANSNRAVRPRAEFVVGSVVAVIGFAWLTSRGAIDVSSNAWQGIMLDGAYPVPIFAQALSASMAILEPSTRVIMLNVFTRLLGALTCAGIAAITVSAARRAGSVGEASICGVLAGVIFVLSQSVTSAFTASWPGAITVACAVWGIAALMRASQRRSHGGRWLIIGAALCAAAAANHSFFGWMVILLVGVVFVIWRRNSIGIPATLVAFALPILIVSIPAVTAIAVRGESPNSFLGRVLRGPYPTLGEQAPDWDAILVLGGQFHPLVWVLALAAVILMFQRFARMGVFASLTLFSVAGPLAPALMNHYDEGAFLRDDMALEVMAIAGFAMLFGLGLIASMHVIFRRAQTLGYRAAMAVLVLAIVALHQSSIAPDRRTDLSGAFAQTMLDGCPRSAVLVVEDRAIAGMLVTAQHAYTHRRDVRIVPVNVLTNPAARHYYRRGHPDGIHIDRAYDTERHLAGWQRERPLLANALLKADPGSHAHRSALNELILWEFVRDNLGSRPIAFAGVDADWLHARAAVNGLVQVYPRVDAPLTDSMEAWLAMKTTRDVITRDPELPRAFSTILLSLSATRRAQDQGERATRLAALSTQFAQGNAQTWIALARAAARNGRLDDADVYSETGLRIGQGDADETAAMLQRDYESYALVAAYREDLDEWTAQPDDRLRRQKMAAELWGRDEVAVLAELMERELGLESPTAPNLYEVAATQAQLGNLESARRHLRDAIALAPDRVAERLKDDGRFVLLQLDHLPSPHQTSL